MTTLLLIDGSNYLFRAFHALPPLTTSKGEPTGAMKGFNGMLKTVYDAVKPDYAACVFDAHGKNFRHAIFADYKANRPPMPEELRVQIEPIFELVRLKGWPLLQVPGVEADDVLGTLAKQGKAAGMKIVIATGDKDMAQLVDEDVTLINTMTRTRYDRQAVFEKYGVWPEQIIDYLSLMGDKVDNVPGVEKCGPKTAARWLAEHGTLEAIMENAANFGGKIGEYLRAGLPFLPIARQLVTINTEADVGVTVNDLVVAKPDEDKLTAFYTRWEMRSAAVRSVKKAAPAKAAAAASQPAQTGDLFASVPQDSVGVCAEAVPSSGNVRVLLDEVAMQAFAAELEALDKSAPPVAVTLLSDAHSPMTDTPVGAAFAVSPLRTCYVPLTAAGARESFVRTFGVWFASAAPKVLHDAKYARHVLKNIGIDLSGPVEDTMLMSYVLEAHLKHELSRIAARTLSSVQPELEALLGKGASRRAAREVPLEQAAPMVATMAAVVRASASQLLARLANDEGLERIYREVELPSMAVLWTMERTGVLLDTAKLSAQSAELKRAIDEVTNRINEIAGESFNPSSPKQLAQVLFEKLGLPVKKKTSTGAPSTDEEVLSELAMDYPLPKLILEYRALTKLKSTYTDKLPQMVLVSDGRVHTTFGQATAVTGRLASSDPNLQNIPVRTAEGRRVREAFTAPAGCKIVSADYSQIELRIMAHISGDEGLIAAFREGRDIHRATAAEVFGVALEAVTAEQRRMAKVINFGLIYGMSAFGLAQNLGLERSTASHYIEQYFARYPRVKAYMDNTREIARARGYVETAFGRRLWLPDVKSSRAPVRAAAERAAINAPMQGTAADLIKFAMVAVAKWLEDARMKARMVLQVHDELVLEVPEDELEAVRTKLPELMAGVASLRVPLIAEVGVGDNWEAAH